MQGWFHGHGVFWRADGMKFEGEFRGGRVWGLGKIFLQLVFYSVSLEKTLFYATSTVMGSLIVTCDVAAY